MVFDNFQDNREKQKAKIKSGQLICTADVKRVFSTGDSTNWSYFLYTMKEVIHDTIPSNGKNYLPERYNENLLRSTNLTLDENNQIMKELNLFQ